MKKFLQGDVHTNFFFTPRRRRHRAIILASLFLSSRIEFKKKISNFSLVLYSAKTLFFAGFTREKKKQSNLSLFISKCTLYEGYVLSWNSRERGKKSSRRNFFFSVSEKEDGRATIETCQPTFASFDGKPNGAAILFTLLLHSVYFPPFFFVHPLTP